MNNRTRADFEESSISEETGGFDKSAMEPPAKIHRTSKACIQCRARKQKCTGPGSGDMLSPSASELSLRQPCRRCSQSAVECSFTTSPSEDRDENSGTASVNETARKVDQLQKQISDQGNRISQLEKLLGDHRTVMPPSSCVNQTTSSSIDGLKGSKSASTCDGGRLQDEGNSSIVSPASERSKTLKHGAYRIVPMVFEATDPTSRRAALDAVDFGTPMSTLRHLRPEERDWSVENEALDPIMCGVMSMDQAQEAFDTFFSNCHKWAPVLCPRTQTSAASVRQACPALFLSVCCVGYRYASTLSAEASRRYMALVSLLDNSLSRLLLRPNSSDVHLNHIRSILLYIQWMPIDIVGASTRSTRYNDITAWSMLGLAIRYALFLGLHQDAVLPFSSDNIQNATVEDVGRLRVWINLLTCDANLMLSSGLPASLNPEPVVAVARCYMAHHNSTQPDDTRSTAICELVSILKRAARSSGSPNVRSLDAICLRRVNLELDMWESDWSTVISDQIKHYQMPFTTLRYYRLAINSACLSPLLRPERERGQISIHVLHALEVSLDAASKTIFSLSEQSEYCLWGSYTTVASLPSDWFTPDEAAVSRIKFSVDSTWITYSFAVTFLVFFYARGVIDDELKILALCIDSDLVTFPQRPAAESLLYRLITLASEILGIICTDSLAHPAIDQKALLSGVFAVVLGDMAADDEDPSESQRAPYSDRELEALFDSMLNNPDISWQTT